MTEDQLQTSVARYLDVSGYPWFHCPNGGSRNPIEGAKLKGMGVKRGVPDVLIVQPTDQHCGLAIELKVGRNRQTPEQKDWQEVLIGCGWAYEVCRSLDEVMEVVDRHYNRKRK